MIAIKKDLIEIWKKHFYEHIENVDNYFSQNRDKVLFFELGKTNLNELIDFLPEMDFKYKHNLSTPTPQKPSFIDGGFCFYVSLSKLSFLIIV